ncbi:small GTP-binding protein [Pyrobaculum islandicum DSM 4184]|uniref:Small GTP-binding protein n=1 Tax=Pyrobaculum islandicum (strain DSM 4184 / JCM 9189 / GEO3) TaxID=384616 RepID=A1RR59_PYRIL|nr:ferrous iron transporter B [Pyrobaculum islandicum]ABL87441.1 small GTP-binding protein [Pyrobaculum islandicum DSM 4184]
MATLRYALAGPANVGKSSLFYALTGIYVRTANYPGTTVEIRRASIRRGGVTIEVVDLPGIINIKSPVDEDERVAFREAFEGTYDGVVVVAAPHAIKEAIELAKLVSQKKPVIFVYNMVDLAKPPWTEEELSKILGVPVVFTSAVKRVGINKLTELMTKGAGGKITGDVHIEVPAVAALKTGIFARPPFAVATLLSLGLAMLFFLLAFMEGVTPFGEFPYAFIPTWDSISESVAEAIKASVGDPVLASLLADGLWDALSTVVSISVYVLVALALVLFFEDSGLIGLLTYKLERRLAALGIPPRGVVCLLVGASCNVPAVSTARVLWGHGNRLLTALLVSYVPCVARLAIFTAVAVAALTKTPYLIPLAIFLPYAAAFAIVWVASAVYRLMLGVKPAPAGEVPPTPLMLPNGRIYLTKLAISMKDFLIKVVLLIAIFVVALWPLTHFGPSGYTEDMAASYLAEFGRAIEPLFAPLGLPWNVAASLVGGWVFKEVVLGLMEGLKALDALAALPLPSVLAFLVFSAFYSACVATLAAAYRTAGAKATALSAVVQLALAYAAAYLVFVATSVLAH